jgi:hypothetical protein
LLADCPVFKEYAGVRAGDTTRLPQQSFVSVAACQTACVGNANCKGIDFEPASTNKCYFIQVAGTTRVTDTGSTYYNLECRGQVTGKYGYVNILERAKYSFNFHSHIPEDQTLLVSVKSNLWRMNTLLPLQFLLPMKNHSQCTSVAKIQIH